MADSKVTALINPVRLRIASVFGDKALTTKQISDILPDISQGNLYRNVKELADIGILEVVEERPKNGSIERVYKMNSKEALLVDEDVDSAISRSLKKYYICLVNELMRDIY